MSKKISSKTKRESNDRETQSPKKTGSKKTETSQPINAPTANSPKEKLFDLSGFQNLDTSDCPSRGGGAGIPSLSIVNTKGNGKRIGHSKELLYQIGNPKFVQVLSEKRRNRIVLIPKTVESDVTYELKGRYIYSYKLVHKLTKEFDLDYSRRTSRTFRKIKIKTTKLEGVKVKVAVIDMITEGEDIN